MSMFAATGLMAVLTIGCASTPAARGGSTSPVEELTGPSTEPSSELSSELSSGRSSELSSGRSSELSSQPSRPLAVPSAPANACEARVGADRLRRSALKRTIDGGLGRWLQTVSVDPLLARGHFKGWIIRSLDPGDDCYAGVDLHAGDVVTRINGRGLEHPEEALAVWTAVPASPELVIDFVRDGHARTMRFGIVDQ
jgi:hypothetical protein